MGLLPSPIESRPIKASAFSIQRFFRLTRTRIYSQRVILTAQDL